MLKHQFSDFSYAVNTESAKKGYKEILVCYIYNGVEVLRKVYIPEGKGISYVFEARKIIDKEIKDGTLASYSYRFVRRNKKKMIKPKKIVKAVNEGKTVASVSGFTAFNYVVKPSSSRHKKFVEVSYLYNGEKVVRTLKIHGKENDDYIAKAKEKINKEVDSGFLVKYSEKYLKEKALLAATPTKTPVVRSGFSGKAVGAIATVAVLAIAGMGVGMYFLGKSLAPTPTPPEPPHRDEFYVSLYSHECVLDGVGTVKRNELYTGSVEVKPELVNDYRPDVEAIFMGRKQLEDTQYDFDLKEHTLKINVPATDDIVIVAYGISLENIVGEIKYELKDDNTYKITGVTAPEELEIGDITKIIVPNTINNEAGVPLPVTEIDEAAFAGCGNLTDITLPFIGRFKDHQESINEEAPVESTQMLGSIFGDKNFTGGIVTWQDYYLEGDDQPHKMKKWVIPHDLSDVVITGGSEIGLGAFSECSHINDIVIKNCEATEIKDEAFYNCKSLESVTIDGSKVLTVGASAFANCESLLEFDLKGVTTINKNAFNTCSGMQRVFIPEEVTTIKEGAFASVGGLIMVQKSEGTLPDTWDKKWTDSTTAIVYGATPEMKEKTDSEANMNFLLATEELENGETIEVAYVTEYIGEQEGTEIIIPNTLTDDITGNTYPLRYLGSLVFYQYIYAKTLTIKATKLLKIGNYCFAGCTGLETINFEGLTNDTEWSLEVIGVGAFYNCVSLQINDVIHDDVTVEDHGVFPKTLNTILDRAFYNCINITKLAISRVKKLGASVFEVEDPTKFESKLEVVKVHADSESFGKATFLNCTNFRKITYYYNATEEEEELDPQHTGHWYGEKFIEIPDQCFMNTSIGNEGAAISSFCLSIGASAFENCTITKVTFPTPISQTRLKSIGSRAFYNCQNLTTLENLDKNESLEEIGDSAFKNCYSLTEINLTKAKVVNIPDSMCEGCAELRKFCPTTSGYYSVIPATVETIGKRAFAGCSNLGYEGANRTDVDPLKGFYLTQCPNLESIGESAFEGWYSEDLDLLVYSAFMGGQHVYLDDKLLKEAYKSQDVIETKWGWKLNHESGWIENNFYKAQNLTCGSTSLIFQIS